MFEPLNTEGTLAQHACLVVRLPRKNWYYHKEGNAAVSKAGHISDEQYYCR